LIILGEGEDRKALQKQIDSLGMSNQISLPGFVDNPYSFMKKSSLFVLSSRFEGSPNVLVEAMACGTPVVSTDCPSGPKQILKDGKFGLLVPVDDYKKLSDAMNQSIHLKKDEIYVNKLQKRAMDYHVDRSVEEYLGLQKNI
jgi:glycosyltransferase involved in cell wall biosynthesis